MSQNTLLPHKEISANFPPCPSLISALKYHLTDGDHLSVLKDDEIIGSWWPTSSYSMQITLHSAHSLYFSHVRDSLWRDMASGKTFIWDSINISRKRRRAASPEISRTPGSARRGNSTRACILPLSPLDLKHRKYLDSLGLRVCMHADVGRVLVSTRNFSAGDLVAFCSVSRVPCANDAELLTIAKNSPHGSYLHVPRKKSVYINQEFSAQDPIASGDIWYLVNHSDIANCELKAFAQGLAVRAKKFIRENEPLCWTYNSEFFHGEEQCRVDLPSTILVDEATTLAYFLFFSTTLTTTFTTTFTTTLTTTFITQSNPTPPKSDRLSQTA